MRRTVRYTLKTTPAEILEIARSRLEPYPSAEIRGNLEKGIFTARGTRVEYTMKPLDGGTELELSFLRTPPVPWMILRSVLDREARQW